MEGHVTKFWNSNSTGESYVCWLVLQNKIRHSNAWKFPDISERTHYPITALVHGISNSSKCGVFWIRKEIVSHAYVKWTLNKLGKHFNTGLRGQHKLLPWNCTFLAQMSIHFSRQDCSCSPRRCTFYRMKNHATWYLWRKTFSNWTTIIHKFCSWMRQHFLMFDCIIGPKFTV